MTLNMPATLPSQLVDPAPGKALRLRQECQPETIDTDQNEAYGKAIRALKRADNLLEADHGAL